MQRSARAEARLIAAVIVILQEQEFESQEGSHPLTERLFENQICEDDLAHNEIMDGRSEEHTSELQSLMRISYAVFCLKKKKQKNTLKSKVNTAKQDTRKKNIRHLRNKSHHKPHRI